MSKDIKNKYTYILYGIKISSNIKLNFLPVYNSEAYYDNLDVVIVFKITNDCFNGDIKYFIKNEILTIILGNYAQYNFSRDFLTLKIICKDYEYLAATFLNLPFTLYFIYANKGLLLHASSIYSNDSLYAFCAPKGTGKSTLLYYLTNYTNLSFYSDDTLAIRINNNNIYFSAGSGILKLKDDVLFKNNLNTKSSMNKYSGKKFYTVLDKFKVMNLYNKKFNRFKILFLERKDNSQFEYEVLKNRFTIKFLLLTNIVGASVFDYEFQKMICQNEVFKYLEENISFSIVKIENNISKIFDAINKIIINIRQE